MVDKGTQRAVELCVRSLAPNAAVESQLERNKRLEALVDEGRVGECHVRVVGRGIVHDRPYELSSTARQLRKRLGEIRAWAREHDATIPGIRTTTTEESCIQDSCYTVTTVPQNFLLEYEGGTLKRCSPSVRDGELFSVDDHLDALHEAVPSEREADRVATEGAGRPADGESEHPPIGPLAPGDSDA